MFQLKQGDGVAMFSPSSPASYTAKLRYDRGKKYLEEKEFQFIEGELTGKSDCYRSGSIQERAAEFNALIRNPEVKCLIAAIGGSNSNSILPYIDYEAFRKNPKIIVGYSDITAILLGIYAKTGITTFYGPAVVSSFGEFPPFVEDTFSYFSHMFCEELNLPHVFPTPRYWTEEFINWNTQDRGKTPVENELITVIGEVDIPILAEFDCCHTHPMLTLPIGATIELDATNKRVTLLEM